MMNDAQAGLMVDMASAEAYGMMGEHQRALAFAERRLVTIYKPLATDA